MKLTDKEFKRRMDIEERVKELERKHGVYTDQVSRLTMMVNPINIKLRRIEKALRSMKNILEEEINNAPDW